MKKTLVTMMITLTSLSLHAQLIRFGVKAGLNFSKETQNAVVAQYISTDLSFRTGWHLGGIMNVVLSDRLELETDLMYSMQGYKDIVLTEAVEQNLSRTNYTVTSHYLTLPVALKFYPVGNLYVAAGPQFGYLLSKRDKLEGWESLNYYTSDKNRNFDFGILGGIGYRFNDNFFIDLRYIHGFTGTSKVVNGSKNRNIQVSLGYLF